MAHIPPTQSVWAISDTASDALTISRGIMEAATSDNINPLALINCESFGATLPLSIETRVKIEQLARRSGSSHVIKFIQAQVGWKKGDSVELLSRSDGGIRFLCLAATLSTVNRYEAALRLDFLLQETQKSTQLKPTISQLQALMAVLNSKLALSDFGTLVAGWEIWFQKEMAQFPHEEHKYGYAAIPSKKALGDLVLAISEISRLGEEHTLNLKTTSIYIPWCISFIKWSIGVPPFRKA